MNLILILVVILGITFLIEMIFRKIDLENYSPIWEYFAKSFLYGLIAAFTFLWGNDSIDEVSPLEWAIIAVSLIEGAGNYINFVKESKKRKEAKALKPLTIDFHF